MATDKLKRALDHVRQALPPPHAADQSDEQLLRRFLAERDELAFATLVRRHGAMVLGLCRRILGHVQDSEDAFQAAFLVLAQKARTVLNGRALGGWLYTVAYRIAMQGRAANAVRRQKERQVKELPHPAIAPPAPTDWQPIFDRELQHLPEKYRTVLVLCELEGRPRKEIARQLHLPEGTLSSRLAAARRLLAKRLARAGLAVTGGTLTAVLAQATVSAKVSAGLVWSTTQAAALVAAGQLAALTTTAAVLTKGALKAMLMAKLKGTLVLVTAVAMLGLGTMVCSAGSGAGTGQANSGSDTELEALRKENELLKINLRVTLEKIQAQETAIDGLKRQVAEHNKTQQIMVPLAVQNRVFLNTGDAVFLDVGNLTQLPWLQLAGLATPDLFLGNQQYPGAADLTHLSRVANMPANDMVFLPQSYLYFHAAMAPGQPQNPKQTLNQEVEGAVRTLLKNHQQSERQRVLDSLDKVRQKLAAEPVKP
jgi:RNA polymerase sigma factor (sigma-70 family)